MSNPYELGQYIRFQLGSMKERNDHHAFEHLTRQLARQTVCTNILPATGPVAGTGDQGRDFETFRSYLCTLPIKDHFSTGVIPGKKIVFACSLQNKGIEGKIKADVKTICGAPDQIDAIYFYCEYDIKTARRHALQAWAKKNAPSRTRNYKRASY